MSDQDTSGLKTPHARGLAAPIAYAEMPFAIRRRQDEPAAQNASG